MVDDGEIFPILDINTIDKIIPDEVVKIGETIGHYSVLKLGKAPDYYEEIVICDVISPSCFWIHLRKKLLTFEKISKELNMFYETESAKYLVPSVAIKVGLNVACMYDDKWHRGIIRGTLPDDNSYVYFHDFGTVVHYPPRKLYFLHRKFSYLPAQAILCSLNNVKPVKKEWRRDNILEFVSKTKLPLIATVITKNVEENSLSVELIDTRGEEDVHINDWVLENFAVKGNMPTQTNRNFSFTYYKKCLVEHGFSPSIICNLSFNLEDPVLNSLTNLNNSDAIDSCVSSQGSSLIENPVYIDSSEIYECTYKENQKKAQELVKTMLNVSLLPRACPPPTKTVSKIDSRPSQEKRIFSQQNKVSRFVDDLDDLKFVKCSEVCEKEITSQENIVNQDLSTSEIDKLDELKIVETNDKEKNYFPRFLLRTMKMLDQHEEKKTQDNLRKSLDFMDKEDSPERDEILEILNL